MTIFDSASQAASQNPGPVMDLGRVNLNALARDFAYNKVNRPAWQVAAAAVAPPLLATATVTTQVKSTNTTQMMLNGVLTSLTATDPLLLAANFALGDSVGIAAGYVRRYQICWDGTNATTVITARPSDTHSIAGSPLGTAASALNQCRWSSLPPTGTAIVGILSVANTTNPFVPGTTLLGAAGVTATYVDGPDQYCDQLALTAP